MEPPQRTLRRRRRGAGTTSRAGRHRRAWRPCTRRASAAGVPPVSPEARRVNQYHHKSRNSAGRLLCVTFTRWRCRYVSMNIDQHQQQPPQAAAGGGRAGPRAAGQAAGRAPPAAHAGAGRDGPGVAGESNQSIGVRSDQPATPSIRTNANTPAIVDAKLTPYRQGHRFVLSFIVGNIRLGDAKRRSEHMIFVCVCVALKSKHVWESTTPPVCRDWSAAPHIRSWPRRVSR